MSAQPYPFCSRCRLEWVFCICFTKPVEPGGEGDEWLKQRAAERAAKAPASPEKGE